MAFSTGHTTVRLEDIEKHLSQAEILTRYLDISKIPCVIPSPLRRDSNPSFGIYSRDGVKVYWTDFATKEKGNLYDLLMKMWHCDFKEAISRLAKDLGINNNNNLYNPMNISKSFKSPKVYSNISVDLKCKVREWRDYDIEYWASYGVPLKWLKYAEVFPISHKIIVKHNKNYVLKADKYAYAFVERKEGKITLKIYQPFNKHGYKWSNKHDRSVISLWTKIPEYGDKLIICSSLKDALCLWANIGIPAIAVQGEGYGISDTALSELRRRFREVYILFDNDRAGLEDGKSLSAKTGFKNIILPQFEGGKDISDLFKAKGKEEFISIIKKVVS